MSKAEAFEVNFGENKSIGVNVNFSKGDAIQVPVSINSLDAEKVGKEVGDRIAEKLDETALASVAKESTLLVESQHIQDEIRDIDFSSVETKIDEVKQAVENIDLSPVESKVEEGVNTLSSKIDNIDLSAVENKVQEESAAIKEKIDNIKLPEIDTSALAKQGENQEATNTAIYALLSQFGESVLQEKVVILFNSYGNIKWNEYSIILTQSDGSQQTIIPISEYGTCSFSINIGNSYTIQFPAIDSFLVPKSRTYTAVTTSKDIYISYVNAGVFGIDELGRRYTIEQIEMLADKSVIKYGGFTNETLETSIRDDGTVGNGIMWDLTNLSLGSYSWSSQQIEFSQDLLPFTDTEEKALKRYDGKSDTQYIISEGKRLGVETPAATACQKRTINVNGATFYGFLPAYGQIYPLCQNYGLAADLYTACGLDSSVIISHLKIAIKLTTCQVNAAQVGRIRQYNLFNPHVKTDKSATLVFFELY